MLGRVLPGQREGAAEWFSNLKQTLKEANLVPCTEAPTVWSNKEKTVVLLIHVDDIAMTGTDEELEKLTTFLKTKYKVAIEEGAKLSFLKPIIEVDETSTNIYVNDKYVDGLVALFGGVRKKRHLGR